MRKGIGGHQSATSRTNSWITPQEIIQVLGPFDLDPCASTPQPWPCAKSQYTIAENGLLQPWFGRVFMNPPYSNDEIGSWLKLFKEHGNGISLVFARTDRANYHEYLLHHADAILFKKGRITFYTPAGTKARANGGASNIFVAFGDHNVQALGDSGIPGKLFFNQTPIIIVGVSPSWKSVVTMVMTQLNEATVSMVYDMVERIAPDKVDGNENWKAKIRQQLQYHFAKIKRGYYGRK